MWSEAWWTFLHIWYASSRSSMLLVAAKFFPFALLLEFPLQLLVFLGILRWGLRRRIGVNSPKGFFPRVSCLITCYSEGEEVKKTIRSLVEQDYAGTIEIIPMVDGAIQNAATLRAARQAQRQLSGRADRQIQVVPKWQRGGRVSSLNTGLAFAHGTVVMALDGDTSFDNDMVRRAVAHFVDFNVIGVAGNLRVRNGARSLATRFQAMEYLLSISAGRTGLSEFNMVNNISGAFGVFRASFLRHIGGWDTGAAEDLDLTLRMKQFFGRHPGLRIIFDPHVVGHTDVPESFTAFFRQRWRWDGDLYYLYIRKYGKNFRPSVLGWKNFLFTIYSGLIQQLLLPFIIVLYTIFLFVSYPPGPVLGILGFVYFIYFLVLSFLYGLYMLLVSERWKDDLSYAILLPFYPLFAFFVRVNSSLAILQEMLWKTHLESSMAPWWVLRKSKF